jgi:hypothetical protein
MSLLTLVKKYNPDTIYFYDGELALGNPNLEASMRFRDSTKPKLIMGHYSYGAHRLLAIKPKYITVLREPISRVISLYYYLKTRHDSPLAPHFNAGLSIDEFISSEITEMTNNHMCRMIAGIPPEAGLNINEEWLLDLAIHNIKRHYVLIGVMDEIEVFLASLSKLLNWPSSEFPKENVNQATKIIHNSHTIKLIQDKNLLDIQLYEYVKNLIET